MKRTKTVKALLLVLPLLIGTISAIISKNMTGIYGKIVKPTLSPPSYIFPIVWSILYLLMGIASVIVYGSDDSSHRTVGLYLHFMQLIFNFFWSIIFFNFGLYIFAFIWLILLMLVVVSMIFNYGKVSFIASLMNAPYLVWLIFAGYLNFMICILN